MSEPKKGTAPAFRVFWSAQPLSYVYYLVLWGVPDKRIVRILTDILPGRTDESIINAIDKMRNYITAKKSGQIIASRVTEGLRTRIDQAIKIPVSSMIARFKEEGTGFKPKRGYVNGPSHGNSIPKPEQLTEGAKEPESPFKHQKLVTPLGGAIDPKQFSSISDPKEINRRATTAKLASEEDHKKFAAAQKTSSIPSSWIVPKEPTEPSVLDEIKSLVTFARGLGATEVEYKGVKIKF